MLWVSLETRVPVIQILNSKDKKPLFDIYLQPKEIIGTPDASNNRVIIDPIIEEKLWMRNGGRRVKIASTRCDFFVSPQWLIYASDNANLLYHGSYAFDQTNQAVRYTIANQQNIPQFSVLFQIQGILK